MDDAGGVGGGEAPGHLHRDPQRLRHGQATPRQPLPQALALQALHGDPRTPHGVLADVVDGDDVGMVEGRSGLRLQEEAPRALGIGHRRRVEQLDGHRAPEARVAGAVQHTHAAFAELVVELEALQGLAGHLGIFPFCGTKGLLVRRQASSREGRAVPGEGMVTAGSGGRLKRASLSTTHKLTTE